MTAIAEILRDMIDYSDGNLHDIACPLCREKYGNTNGSLQEKEGAVFLVGHHHTLSEIDGDYQILIEADYLVNANESNYSSENIKHFCYEIFKTETGTMLLKSIYTF